jgi:hypothetical protein
VALQQVESDGRVGGMHMRVAAVELRAVELLADLGAAVAVGVFLLCLLDPRALGEFAEIVQIGRQRDAARGFQKLMRLHQLLP